MFKVFRSFPKAKGEGFCQDRTRHCEFGIIGNLPDGRRALIRMR